MNLRALAVLMLVVSCAPPPPEDCSDAGTCPMPACVTGATRPCSASDVGACRKGTEKCVDGAWSKKCDGAVLASAESCNGVDDDCNGGIDDGVGQPWYADSDNDGFGAAATVQVACTKPVGFSMTSNDCNDSSFSINPSATEACDVALVDENCDGTQNEGCACTLGMTVTCCAGRGSQTCADVGAGPMLSSCSVVSVAETCNGIDDDCDGQIDEGVCPVDAGIPTDAGTPAPDAGPASVGASSRRAATPTTTPRAPARPRMTARGARRWRAAGSPRPAA